MKQESLPLFAWSYILGRKGCVMSPSSHWESVYQEVSCLFGLHPNATLVEYASLVPEGKVLDLGMGEGGNALFFAKRGYDVHGVDISATAVSRALEHARASSLHLNGEVADITDLTFQPNSYSLIIAAMVLQFFTKAVSEQIIERIRTGLKPSGIVFIAVFSTEDPSYERLRHSTVATEPTTFYVQKWESYVHYFTRDEILEQFATFNLIYSAQIKQLDLTHDEPHYHGIIVYIGQKPEDN
jgi:2-polyprenyl-3-methyl-5-hydroxy-6-metoxy-1,4-benzoquinol methylase